LLGMSQTQSVQQLSYLSLQLLRLQVSSQSACKQESLIGCHCLNQDIVLLDKSSEFTEVILMDKTVVGSDLSIQLWAWRQTKSLSQDIQQWCLATTWGTHDSNHLSGLSVSTDVMKDFLHLLVSGAQVNACYDIWATLVLWNSCEKFLLGSNFDLVISGEGDWELEVVPWKEDSIFSSYELKCIKMIGMITDGAESGTCSF
jgi:hypothetical protein